MNSGILIQARMSSVRFPGKMLEKLGGYHLVEFVYRRCLEAKKPSVVAVITSEHESDNELFNFCTGRNIKIFRGSLDNVLARYIGASQGYDLDTIVRVCGDSPFVDVQKIDEMLELYQQKNLEYVHFDKETVLWGLDSEVVGINLLKRIASLNLASDDKEHVTLYIKKNIEQFKTLQITSYYSTDNVKQIKLTVDFKKDLEFCNALFKYFESKQFKFTSKDVDLAIMEESKQCVE